VIGWFLAGLFRGMVAGLVAWGYSSSQPFYFNCKTPCFLKVHNGVQNEYFVIKSINIGFITKYVR
jgi:hypothetical protein